MSQDAKDVPANPVTPLNEMANQTHEMFLAYIEAGFTRFEALQIIIGITSSMAAQNASRAPEDPSAS